MSVIIAPFNFLGITDIFTGIFDYLPFKKIAPTQVEQIKEIATTAKNKVAEKIIDSDTAYATVVSESLRNRYKGTILEDMTTKQRVAAILSMSIISALIMYFFGPYMLEIFKGFLSEIWDSSDDNNGGNNDGTNGETDRGHSGNRAPNQDTAYAIDEKLNGLKEELKKKRTCMEFC